MKTVLFFISSTRHTCTNRLGGILRYARTRDWHVQVVERQSTRRMACDRGRVAEAVEMIRRRACEGISAAEVVKFIGEPRRTAEMHFREATGRSIHDEIDEVRFAKVFELLKNPRQSIDAIPDLCGFKTGVALRKAFRLRTGMSMSDWRKRP